MKRFLIVYSSKTGNTEKVAQALYSAMPEECDLKKAGEVASVEGYEVIFAGYWVDKGAPNKEMQNFLAKLQGKKVVLFQTLGAEPYSEHGMTSFANAGKYLSADCQVMGVLSIRGAIDPQLIAMMSKMPAGSPHAPTPESKKRWADASVHPDAQDLANAKAYMAKFCAFYDKFYKAK